MGRLASLVAKTILQGKVTIVYFVTKVHAWHMMITFTQIFDSSVKTIHVPPADAKILLQQYMMVKLTLVLYKFNLHFQASVWWS